MSIDAAISIIKSASSADLNEADTRFHIIDRLLREVLGWPTAAFRLESRSESGYADYHLLRPTGQTALILEAKRSGDYFELPNNFNADKFARSVKVKALLTSPSLATAMIQAQGYCLDNGCEYAAVSNGCQTILFKAFSRNKSWRDLPAFVISDLRWFEENYVDAINLLGYTSLTEKNSLRILLDAGSSESREIFFPKEKIIAFNQIINANSLSSSIRGIVQKYFGPIDIEDPQFVERCYVNQRTHDKSLQGIRTLIQDSVTPFMASYGVSETEDADSGGKFTNRLTKAVKTTVKGDVVILFGGKGAGKSTFIRKVLLHKPPQYLKKHSHPIIVDLLSAPKDEEAVRTSLWRSLVTQLDSEKFLAGERSRLLSLFSDRYAVALRQDLMGIPNDSVVYNERLNGLVASWKSDVEYVAKCLVSWHAKQHRGVIVAIDNTDQLENVLQDYAFSLAVDVSEQLKCVVLISMREERFYASKIRGMLDAYQNSAFHISSPMPEDVFTRRIGYVLDLLQDGQLNIYEEVRDDVKTFFEIFRNDFRKTPSSALNRFVSACAQGNIRLALDLFGDLVLSGYTNATEMIQVAGGWTIAIHQVLKPLLTPTRLFYDEKLSKIPNLFQVRAIEGGSHFTGLRILKRLSIGQDPVAPAYVSFGEVRSYFSEIFGNDADFRAWIDRLLSANLVEASTRQDYFSEDIDALRVTSLGQFCLSELHKAFTYVDLVSTDCGIRDESTSNDLVRFSNLEVQLQKDRKRFERIERRIDRSETFIAYLKSEEDKEVDLYALSSEYEFVPGMIEAWSSEKPGVLSSARRNK